jgi:hypothetical protein
MVGPSCQPLKRGSSWNPSLFTGGEREVDTLNSRYDQITIFWVDEEPPDPDDYLDITSWLTAWESWENQYPSLAAEIQGYIR